MTTPPGAVAFGLALARIGKERPPAGSSDSPGLSHSRLAVLRFLETAGEPRRIDDIAESTGLHPNTVRGHLDALMSAGRASRLGSEPDGRGRPAWLYSAKPSGTAEELAAVLKGALEAATAPELARDAAISWAKTLPGVAHSTTPDGAVDAATAALTHLGFDAVRNEVGDAITLRACPYASLVHDHPVICDVHAGVLVEVFRRTGQPVGVGSLDVFATPYLCVAHLTRPDTTPEWIVTLEESE
jgi:predicted ArsR family transcriptional regulator